MGDYFFLPQGRRAAESIYQVFTFDITWVLMGSDFRIDVLPHTFTKGTP